MAKRWEVQIYSHYVGTEAGGTLYSNWEATASLTDRSPKGGIVRSIGPFLGSSQDFVVDEVLRAAHELADFVEAREAGISVLKVTF